MGFVARVFQPSTLRMLIWPEASKAQNNIAAVSADGSTVCVLIRRLNSSCSLSIAFDAQIDFHWLIGKRVKVKSCWWIRRASNCLEDFFAKPPSREERAHDLATGSNPNTGCSN